MLEWLPESETIDETGEAECEQVETIGGSGDGQTDDSEGNNDSSLQKLAKGPTVWFGSQSGSLYVHSALQRREECINKLKLADSILAIVYVVLKYQKLTITTQYIKYTVLGSLRFYKSTDKTNTSPILFTLSYNCLT